MSVKNKAINKTMEWFKVRFYGRKNKAIDFFIYGFSYQIKTVDCIFVVILKLAYLLIKLKNSLRVSRSSRKTPPNADVTV